jgi:hypothetical protein
MKPQTLFCSPSLAILPWDHLLSVGHVARRFASSKWRAVVIDQRQMCTIACPVYSERMRQADVLTHLNDMTHHLAKRTLLSRLVGSVPVSKNVNSRATIIFQ